MSASAALQIGTDEPPTLPDAASDFTQGCRKDTFGKITFIVVEDVGEVGDAMAGLRRSLAIPLKKTANQITDGFRAILLTAPCNQGVKFSSQLVVETDRETFHARSFRRALAHDNLAKP